MTTFLQHIQPFSIGIIFLLIYVAEHFFPQRNNPRIIPHDVKNIGYGIVNSTVVFGAGYYFQQLLFWTARIHFGLFNNVSLPGWIAIPLQLLLIDIFMYWWHRFNHRWNFLWQFHRLHHRDEMMNSTTALRFHILELSLAYIARLLIFPALGISATAVLVYGLIFFPVVMMHHSNIRIGEQVDLLIRKWIVTPRMHRIHHSKIHIETNSNYSSIFPWWDAVFRTYRKNPMGELSFGIGPDNANV